MAKSKSTMATPAPQRDALFYFESVTFLVEDVLFKVPRLYFETNSTVFGDMFTLPTTEQQEGSSDQNPIKLESIKKVDFQRLLTAIFPELSSCAQVPVVMGYDGWTSVLKLSTLWEFKQTRQQAVDKLSQSSMKPIDKVLLARTYKVEKWLVEGYAELVRRDGGISSEEKQTLGHETTLKLYEMREDTFKRGLKYRKRIFNDLEHEVHDRFKAEIIGVRCDGEAFSAAAQPPAVPASKKTRYIDSDDDVSLLSST